ncbi:hypothetical protein BV20DRAFT_787199 [Pilatotrama ljubarskyi]|nr:hypothetical protein BV20DRAFT_787199 [Pilatotrama ljubarskyi]
MISVAPAPFDNRETADVILRTWDGVEFHLHRALLFSAASFFADKLSTAWQPAPGSLQRQEIDVDEHSAVWDKFLRLCYPMPDPRLTLDDAGHLLKMAQKYDAPCVTSRLRHVLTLPENVAREPYRVYALAVFSGQHDIARTAARETLRHPITPPTFTESHLMHGDALVRLLQYRERCCAASVDFVTLKDDTVPPWIIAIPQDLCFFGYCDKGWSCWTTQKKLWWKGAAFGVRYVSQYWVTYMESLKAALEQRPDPSAVRTPAFIYAAVETAVDCKRCRKLVSKDLDQFARLLETELERVIAQVELEGGP